MATDIRLDAIASVRGELGNVRTGASEEYDNATSTVEYLSSYRLLLSSMSLNVTVHMQPRASAS